MDNILKLIMMEIVLYNATKMVIPSLAISNNSYMFHNTGNTGTNAYAIYDFQSDKTFKTSLKIGKCNTWADIKTFRLEYSTNV